MMVYLPGAEVIGIFDCSEGGTINEEVEKFFPGRTRNAKRLSRELKHGVVVRAGRDSDAC